MGANTPPADGHSNGPPTHRQTGWFIICNPASGDGEHTEAVHALAADRGDTIEETEEAGDAVTLAADAARDGYTQIAACGGDGTVHQVVAGLDAADALAEVTLGVIPGGTGNSFAGNIGVEGIEHAFELLDSGVRRELDLGIAAAEPFVNSCIAGLAAETSIETSSELKERYGVLAYVITGLRKQLEFDPLRVELATDAAAWDGEALCLLIGNARRFSGGQANAEDGRFEVTIVETLPPGEMLVEGSIHRLFGSETEHITTLAATELEIASREDHEIEFSLDGELRRHRDLTLEVRPDALETVVGSDYTPIPPPE